MTVFFMHIPKTGGGTFYNAIEPQFKNPAPRMVYAETVDFDFAGYDFISGHYPFKFYRDKLDSDTILVTLLRDPVVRVLSQYAYESEFGYSPDDEYTAAVKGMSLEDWMDYEPARRNWNNLMVRYLTGGRRNIAVAMENLDKFDVVGFLDAHNGLQTAIKKISELAAVKAPTCLGMWNRASNPVALRDLPPSMLGRIQWENALDTILYEYAMERCCEKG